jgi:hypothetical protein
MNQCDASSSRSLCTLGDRQGEWVKLSSCDDSSRDLSVNNSHNNVRLCRECKGGEMRGGESSLHDGRAMHQKRNASSSCSLQALGDRQGEWIKLSLRDDSLRDLSVNNSRNNAHLHKECEGGEMRGGESSLCNGCAHNASCNDMCLCKGGEMRGGESSLRNGRAMDDE